jgi:hypothetical protein
VDRLADVSGALRQGRADRRATDLDRLLESRELARMLTK